MKTTSLFLALVFLASFESSRSYAETQDKERCLAAIQTVNAKKSEYETDMKKLSSPKERAARCDTLKVQIEFLAESESMLNVCRPLHNRDITPLLEKVRALTDKIKNMRDRDCRTTVSYN